MMKRSGIQGWQFYVSDILAQCKFGKTIWERVRKELRNFGIISSIYTTKGTRLIFHGIDMLKKILFPQATELKKQLDLPIFEQAEQPKTTEIASNSSTTVKHGDLYRLEYNNIHGNKESHLKREPLATASSQASSTMDFKKNNQLTKTQLIEVKNLTYDEKRIYDEITSWGAYLAYALTVVKKHAPAQLYAFLEACKRFPSVDSKRRYFIRCVSNLEHGIVGPRLYDDLHRCQVVSDTHSNQQGFFDEHSEEPLPDTPPTPEQIANRAKYLGAIWEILRSGKC
jgi:hypothetical protein